MEKFEGYKVIEETPTRLVLEHEGKYGRVRLIGNPHPDPVERQKNLDALAESLMRIEMRAQAQANS